MKEKKDPKLIDFHCHLYDLFLEERLDREISEAKAEEIEIWISNALSVDEVKWHLKNDFYWTAGIHPFHKASSTLSIENILALADKNSITAIGEIGYDKRSADFAYQSKILCQQLDIAQDKKIPVIFHLVGHYYDLAKLIRNSFPKIRGVIHSFQGSVEVINIFKDFDIGFSINYNLLHRKNGAIIINEIINWGNYFIETDCPYQKPFNVDSNFNKLTYLKLIYNYIQTTHKIDHKTLKKNIYNNCLNFFDLPIL